VDIESELVSDTVALAINLNYVNIIHKGMYDVVTNGKKAYIVKEEGSSKRCGGIGDILSGLTGLYSYWGYHYGREVDENEKVLIGCLLGSYITRRAGKKAWDKYKLSLTAPNIISMIGESFNEFYFSKL